MAMEYKLGCVLGCRFFGQGTLAHSFQKISNGFWSRDACQAGSVLERDTLCQGTLAKLARFWKGILCVKGRLPSWLCYAKRYFVSRDACQAGSVLERDTLCQGTLAKLACLCKAIFCVKGRLPMWLGSGKGYFVSRDACQAGSVMERDTLCQGTLAKLPQLCQAIFCVKEGLLILLNPDYAIKSENSAKNQ